MDETLQALPLEGGELIDDAGETLETVPLEGKELIDDIYKKTADNKRNSTSFTNTLESNIHTVFNSGHKFIYELLQNADDAEATMVQFTLSESDLVISHNGKQFKSEDVNKICDNAKPDSYKAKQLDKTGYKGVGFKAVFCISKKVTVISEPYCFRFDQSNWQQTADAKYPWPIIPIWTDSKTYEDKLPKRNEFKVHFVLSNIDSEKVQIELNSIFQSTEILLLLRHIRQVTISPDQIEIKKGSEDGLIALERFEKGKRVVHSLWLTEIRPIEIPLYVKEAISNLSAAECPDKLKEAPAIDLIFAAKVTKDIDGNLSLIAIDHAHIYCYLPTQVSAGLPYLINAHFLLNQDRTLLMNNVWNRFLLKNIATEQFLWLKNLASNAHWVTSVLNLLAPHKLLSIEPELNIAYQEGYDAGIKSTDFIPSLTQNRLLKVHEAHIDKTQYFKYFANDFRDDALNDANGSRIVRYDLTAVEKLLELKNYGFKIELYDFEKLLERLDAYLDKCNAFSVELAIRLLTYFKDQQLPPQQSQLLCQRKILLCADNKRREPEKCYLAEGNLDLAQLFELAVVHSKIMENHDLCHWLYQSLGVSKLNKLEVIRSSIMIWIKSDEIKTKDPILVLRFIYDAVREGVGLTDKDYQLLQLLPVLRRDGQHAPINTVYIPPFDNAPLQNIPLNLILADNKYFKPNDDFKIWRVVLIRMGIRTEIGLHLHHSPNSTNTITVAEINAYFALHKFYEPFVTFYLKLKEQHGAELHYNSPSNDVKLINFITYDFLPQIKQEVYYTLFWQAFRANWQQLQQACSYDKNLSKKSSYRIFEIPHYLVYYFQTYACIRVRGKNEWKIAAEVYSPMLFAAEESADLPVSIADVPGGLTLEQARFLGIKTEISFEDCLDLLSKPQCQKRKQLTVLYRCLLKHRQQLDTVKLARLQKWRDEHTLLAANNTPQPIQSLRYFDFSDVPPGEAAWFHPVDLNPNEVSDLANLLKMHRASEQRVDNLNGYRDDEFNRMMDKAINITLPIIAILEHRASSEEETHSILKRILETYHQISVYLCKELAISGAELKAYSDNNKLYVCGRWAERYLRKQVAIILAKHYFKLSIGTAAILEDILGSASVPDLEEILRAYTINRKVYDEFHQFVQTYRPVHTKAVEPVEILRPPINDKKPDEYPDDDDIAAAPAESSQPTTPRQNTTTDETNPANVLGSLFYSPINLFKNTPPTPPTGKAPPAPDGKNPNEGKNRTGGGRRHSTQPTQEQQDEYLKRGRLGEQKFYHYLLQSALSKGWTVKENDLGFIATYENKTVSVEWPNKRREDFQPLDFKVIYNEQTYIFEVKSSAYAKKDFVNLSTKEWENMIKFKNNYALVCIFAVESDHPTFDVIWNIFRKIVENSMKPDSMILRWGYNTRDQMLVIPNGVDAKRFVGEETQAEFEQCRMQ